MKIKIFLATIITLVILMCAHINAAEEPPLLIAYDQTPEGLAYSANDDGEITIMGNAGYVNKVVIPDMIDGMPVRYIAKSAFYNNPNITSVTISDNVVKIGVEAFGNCRELTKVILPAGLEEIDHGTFIQCGMLMNIVLPETLKSIGDFAFEGCIRLKKFAIPASVEYIGHEAFIGCESLLMDITRNEYAADYAVKNSIETDYKSSWDYVLLNSIYLTAGALVVCIAVYIVIRVVRNKRKTK